MKKILFLLVLILLSGCARKGPDFIPLSLRWFAYSGDLSAFGSKENPEILSDDMTSQCMISMTQALMSTPEVRANAGDGMDFDVQYYGIYNAGDINMIFRGSCPKADSADYEVTPMALDPKPAREGCAWTARCTESGKIKDLKFLGSPEKVQRRKHLGQ
ncbi:MAG: hypothetical protein WCS54_04775 [Fibrobacteraceae bacterium]